MIDNDILAWLGNFINFLILIYITSAVVNTRCFDSGQLVVATFGLVVSIAISMFIALINRK